jgi:hypothetical protein
MAMPLFERKDSDWDCLFARGGRRIHCCMTSLDPGGGSTESDDMQGTSLQKIKIGEIKLTVTLPTAR